ncbi:MAG: hypothetical protein K2Q26_07730 [Bdellovibrionales bacterium]|nr:hypothetical protein [Bdellovibrionales bacterium]
MDLLNRLNKKAVELWQKHMESKDQQKKEQFLREYKAALIQYVKHKEWLKDMEA